jgi:hypothetical protein
VAACEWPQIYDLACRHSGLDLWVKELRDYMQIMAASIAFAGISEEMVENYNPAIAKRLIRSLMDELRADEGFLEEIGIPAGQPPLNHEVIKTSLRVWDVLSPLGRRPPSQRYE